MSLGRSVNNGKKKASSPTALFTHDALVSNVLSSFLAKTPEKVFLEKLFWLTRASLNCVVRNSLRTASELIANVVEVIDGLGADWHLVRVRVVAPVVRVVIVDDVEHAGSGYRSGHVRRAAAVQPFVFPDKILDDQHASIRLVPHDLGGERKSFLCTCSDTRATDIDLVITFCAYIIDFILLHQGADINPPRAASLSPHDITSNSLTGFAIPKALRVTDSLQNANN
jgi:hypothetical protein